MFTKKLVKKSYIFQFYELSQLFIASSLVPVHQFLCTVGDIRHCGRMVGAMGEESTKDSLQHQSTHKIKMSNLKSHAI